MQVEVTDVVSGEVVQAQLDITVSPVQDITAENEVGDISRRVKIKGMKL